MLETIAGGCRAVASDRRLIMLCRLVESPELAASELARRAGLPVGNASTHLKVLSASGLVERRRSGARIYYRLAGDRPGGGPLLPVALVRRAVEDPTRVARGWDEEGIVHLRPETVATVGEVLARALDVMFDATTAFTNVRRLQIIRLLVQERECGRVEVVGRLKMSPLACSRHLDKLARRGYVRQARGGLWRLCGRWRSALHREVGKWVVGCLEQPLRTFEGP